MPCNRCGAQLEDDLEAKSQIMIDIFGPEGNLLCDTCNARFVERVKHYWHALTCKTCWEYHNVGDFKRWVKRMVGM
jgi:hypothetical protein